MIKKLILRAAYKLPNYNNFYRPISNLKYLFSNQKTNEKQQQTLEQMDQVDRASNFYRNSVRKININDKGRGKFTQHHLLRLIKLTQNVSQAPLLFEAYYNYLGHYTVISSTTVDKMLAKVLGFSETPLSSVLEVFANHNYLAYFPSYKITQNVILAVENNQELLAKLIETFHHSPLIKFNKQIVQTLLSLLKKQDISKTNFSRVIKLILQRKVLNLLDPQFTNMFLLKQLAQIIQLKYTSQQPIMLSKTQYLTSFLQDITQNETPNDQLHFNFILLSTAFTLWKNVSEHLLLIKDQNKVRTLFTYLKQTNTSFKTLFVNSYENKEVSAEYREQLQKLIVQEEQATTQ